MYTDAANLSTIQSSDLQSAKRLDQDPILKERFANLMSGAQKSLESGTTSLQKAALPKLEGWVETKNLQESVVKDVVSLEKGIKTFMEITDDAARKNYSREETSEFGEMAEVFFQYGSVTSRYFVMTNYVNGSATRTSEEIQIFTKGR
jgi:hypothetical protein